MFNSYYNNYISLYKIIYRWTKYIRQLDKGIISNILNTYEYSIKYNEKTR